MPCYLRTYRRLWRLTQIDLAQLLGCGSGSQISRYEWLVRRPCLKVALGCQVIFGIPPNEMFPSHFGEIEEAIMRRASKLYARLDGRPDAKSQQTLKLLREILARATKAANNKKV